MRRLPLTLLLWAVVLSASAQVRLGGGSVVGLPDGTQLAFRISGPIQYESFILNNPPRFVVDIQNARVDEAGVNLNLRSPDIRAVRTGVRHGRDLRIVVDLADFVRSKSSVVSRNGHHLVVDVFREERLAPDIARVRVVSHPVEMISQAETSPPAPPALPSLGAPRLTARTTRRAPSPVIQAVAQQVRAPDPVPTAQARQPAPDLARVPVPRPRPEVPPAASDGPVGGLLALLSGRRDESSAAGTPTVMQAAAPTLATFPAPTPPPVRRPARDRIVVIDPGHGGKDPGAIGPNGTYEKDVVLPIALRLRDLINREPGLRAVMTRDNDRFIRLYDRIAIARQKQADMFISIHADAIAGNPRAGGSSVYILSTSGASSARARYLARKENEAFLIGGDDLKSIDDSLNEVIFDIFHDAVLADSMALAENVIGELSQVGRVHRRRVERAGFAVLKSPDVPSVLVETAFISNPSEEKNLKTTQFQDRVAQAILRGIKNFLRDHPLRDDDDRQLAGGGAGGTQIHVIQPGENLSAIARRYRVPVAELRSANGLHGDRVMAGSSLTIPFSLSGS